MTKKKVTKKKVTAKKMTKKVAKRTAKKVTPAALLKQANTLTKGLEALMQQGV